MCDTPCNSFWIAFWKTEYVFFSGVTSGIINGFHFHNGFFVFAVSGLFFGANTTLLRTLAPFWINIIAQLKLKVYITDVFVVEILKTLYFYLSILSLVGWFIYCNRIIKLNPAFLAMYLWWRSIVFHSMPPCHHSPCNICIPLIQ